MKSSLFHTTLNSATNVVLMSLEKLFAIYATKKQVLALNSTALLSLKSIKRDLRLDLLAKRFAPLKNQHATSNQSLNATFATTTATSTAHELIFKPLSL
jgi:hypothetical protein